MTDTFLLNLPRWVYASAAKFFQEEITSQTSPADRLPIYVEGQERRTEDLTNYLEFRLDGPYIVELSKGYYKAEIEINILCVIKIDPTDFHKIYRTSGIALSCFKAIPIYKYGDGPNDDQSLIDCMIITRSTDQRETIRVSHFGRLDPTKSIVQSSVEGHYHCYLTG